MALLLQPRKMYILFSAAIERLTNSILVWPDCQFLPVHPSKGPFIEGGRGRQASRFSAAHLNESWENHKGGTRAVVKFYANARGKLERGAKRMELEKGKLPGLYLAGRPADQGSS